MNSAVFSIGPSRDWLSEDILRIERAELRRGQTVITDATIAREDKTILSSKCRQMDGLQFASGYNQVVPNDGRL